MLFLYMWAPAHVYVLAVLGRGLCTYNPSSHSHLLHESARHVSMLGSLKQLCQKQ